MSRIVIFIVLVALAVAAVWFVQGKSDVGVVGNGSEQTAAQAAPSQARGTVQTKPPASSQGSEPELTIPETAATVDDQSCDEVQFKDLAEIMAEAESEAQLQNYAARQKQSSERLSVSTETEHLLVAAMQSEAGATRLQLIGRALEISPDSAVTLWTAAHMCSRLSEQHACPLADWTERLLKVDSTNTESWMLAAGIRYRAGDKKGALNALRQAASAPETNIFWSDVVEMVERSLAAAGGHTFPERVSMAFGTAVTGGPDYRAYTSMCAEQSAVDAEWASLCLAYGERAEQQSRTALGESIARAIQRIALREMGEIEKYEQVVARTEESRKERRESPGIPGLQMISPDLFYTYLDAIRRVGEVQAQGVLVTEARRILSVQSAAGCE